MNLLYGLIPSLIIISVILISIPIETQAVNEKVLIDYNQKIVWQFEDTNDLITKQNQFEEIMTEEIKSSTKDFKKDFQSLDIQMRNKESAVYIIGTNPINGKSIYEVYPKILFTGTSKNPMNDAEFNILFDTMIDEIRIDLIVYFFNEGYTDVKTHIHYSDGRSVDYDEGF